MRKELNCIYDSAKSFYKKAWVEDDNILISYYSKVLKLENGKFILNTGIYNLWSKTTVRHMKEWLHQMTGKTWSTKDIDKLERGEF